LLNTYPSYSYPELSEASLRIGSWLIGRLRSAAR
jgi:hypothetical protein